MAKNESFNKQTNKKYGNHRRNNVYYKRIMIKKLGENMLKRIFAVIGLIVILGWIIATLALAVFPIPMKTVLFPIFAAGCVILPILLWLLLWMISVVTGKKNIATFEVKKDDEETLSKAADDVEEAVNEAAKDSEENK